MIRRTALFLVAAACGPVALAATVTSAVDDFSNVDNDASSEWSYRWSPDTIRDGVYPLLTTSSDPNATWNPPTPYWNNGGSLPGVGVNQSGSAIPVAPAFLFFSWPDDTIWMHPPNGGLAVVTWTSPVTGTADIEFEFDDMDPNGNSLTTGIRWFVDLGSVTGSVANGPFVNGAGTAPITITDVEVNAGDQLHFIVDPFGDFGFDSTAFRATISYVPEPAAALLPVIGASGVATLRSRRTV